MIKGTLTKPDVVAEGSSPSIRVFYKFHETTAVSSKYLAVVVKELNQEGFIVTAYFTDTMRRAKLLWKRAR